MLVPVCHTGLARPGILTLERLKHQGAILHGAEGARGEYTVVGQGSCGLSTQALLGESAGASTLIVPQQDCREHIWASQHRLEGE